MKPIRQRTGYQRVCLDGTWYVIVREDEFREMTRPRPEGTEDDLDAVSMSDQRLADRLLRRRQEAGLTQKDLALRAGVRVETLNRIEKGRTTPDFGTVRKLVNAMNECRKK
ncbi:MAG TPA: helix-turn-helix transcriptional regulator [Sedimentisphaerales bacterium]|nr:helix-turn-helix transcriptional regulator [Sedimentisphaerales bacterium]